MAPSSPTADALRAELDPGGVTLVRGIMRWRSTRPFSTRPGDWSSGEFVTDVSTAGEGAVDGAVSPDGKQLTVAANFGSGTFASV